MTANMPSAPSTPTGKKQSNTFITIFVFLLAMFILFNNDLRFGLGRLVGHVLNPLIGFGGSSPVLTLILAGIVMTGLTTLIRHFFTDYVAQAQSQSIVSAFNKEFRQARQENNLYKMKKLGEQQNEILQKSMDVSTGQMKLMPFTMLIIIPIFAWVAVFINGLDGAAIVNVPWSDSVDLNKSTILPHWILLYSLISIPFAQILNRTLRYFTFKKRLQELEAEA
ncbi:MAG: DUF106 domain-containing protein [Euryarchaeota archaeon]|nr:DUF106 domain-containing protein [Euryarchaeota archaeon]